MSHTTIVKTVPMVNPAAIAAAAVALGLPAPEQGTLNLNGRSHAGTLVKLPGWHYPVCLDEAGNAIMDNYEGNWGDISHLNAFCQQYSAEQIRLTAEAQFGFSGMNTVRNADGTLTVEVML